MAFELEKEYDVLIHGTGLVESILAAACTRVGKTVLHLDPNGYYGSEWASFNLASFQEWVEAGPAVTTTTAHADIANTNSDTESYDLQEGQHLAAVTRRAVFSPVTAMVRDIEPSLEPVDRSSAAEPLSVVLDDAKNVNVGDISHSNVMEQLMSQSRKFNIDLSAKLCFSGGPFVSLLVRCGVSRYLEFKAIERCFFTGDPASSPAPVPCSKSDVFTAKFLSLLEKRILMKFFQLVTGQQETQLGEAAQPAASISEEEMNLPFTEFMMRKKLPERLQHFVLYAVALSSVDSSHSTRECIARIRLYMSSLGRYGTTPFLVPFYGVAEWGQAFCRMAAVNGGVYILNRGVSQVVYTQPEGADTPVYQGIICSEGNKIMSRYLITSRDLDFHVGDHQAKSTSSPSPLITLRAVCILKGRMFSGDEALVTNVLPPTSTRGAVHVLQLDESSASAPSDYVVVHFTTSCTSSAESARDILLPVIEQQCKINSTEQRLVTPLAFWFMEAQDLQEHTRLQRMVRCSGCSPGLVADNVVEEAEALFFQLFPDDPFLPPPELTEEDMMLHQQMIQTDGNDTEIPPSDDSDRGDDKHDACHVDDAPVQPDVSDEIPGSVGAVE